MAKKPVKTNPSPRAPRQGRSVPESAMPPRAGSEEVEEGLEGLGEVELTELEVIEAEFSLSSRTLEEPEDGVEEPLNEPGFESPGVSAADALEESELMERGEAAALERDEPSTVAGSPAPAESGPAPTGGRADAPKRGFGTLEWAALGGFALVALIAGILFFKFLYAHPAPTEGPGLPDQFELPLAGASVKLSEAVAGWRERVEGDKSQAEEVIVPTTDLELDPAQASSGFVRVEFVDSDDKIRGDIMIVAIEGGRFKDGGRGEVVEDGGRRLRLVGTIGFRSHALFGTYLAGEAPRWSVRIKEGVDYSKGPWNQLGAARIPNKKATNTPLIP